MSGWILHVLRRVGVVVGRLLAYVLIWAGLALLIAAAGIRFYWGKISVGQMLLNLVSVEIDGGGGAVVWMGILGIGVVPLLITAGVALWQYLRRRERRRNDDDVRPRRSRWILRTASTAVVAAVVVGGSTAFATSVSVGDYIRAANSEYDLGDHYVEPTVTSDEHKRNLVLIYIESGEPHLADDRLFGKEAFAPLEEVSKASDGWQSVDGLQQYQGGGWTMAGLTATQCGVPLKGVGSAAGSGVVNELGGELGTYLGGLACLGDVLDEHGYDNVFLGGANASFAAKDTFLSSHGYSEVKDLADWRAAGEPEENFRSDWGLSDERLMAHARDEIDELHAESERSGRPFNLSLLTLDTHEPVHVFDYCDVDAQNKVTSVFSCSMTQVAGFVDHMKEEGYLEDTAVVIMGDHLAPESFHEQLDGNDDDNDSRSIFNRIWIPGEDGNSTLRPRVDQLNMYPTILEAAGLTLQDHEAGLGVSAFTSEIPDGSAQAMEPGPYAELLNSLSPRFYAKVWVGEDAAR
ncbi:LTA synthase family protein [Kocuria sabuli]|uniref:LTA synthase family protein n=1 Tax=Kocuria sabuli TaxID=3071448 RepID=UPI0034D56553